MKRLVSIIIMILIALVTYSCAAVKPIMSNNTSDKETIRIVRDSIHVIEKDSVLILIKGDTVLIEKIRYRDRLRSFIDTLTIRDSIYNEKPVLIDKPLTQWQVFQIWLGRILLGIVLLWIIGKVIKGYLRPLR